MLSVLAFQMSSERKTILLAAGVGAVVGAAAAIGTRWLFKGRCRKDGCGKDKDKCGKKDKPWKSGKVTRRP